MLFITGWYGWFNRPSPFWWLWKTNRNQPRNYKSAGQLFHKGKLLFGGRPVETSKKDWLNTSRRRGKVTGVSNHISEHHRLEPHYRLGLCASGNYYQHHTNDLFTTLTSQTNRANLHHSSLTANNITAKLTNHFIRTGLIIFHWQQLFTWLWWWLSLRLSKRQILLHVLFEAL